MEKIYSKVSPETLLHIIVRKEDITSGRQDIVSEENFIQCSILNMEEGKTFRPHKHIWKQRTRDVIAQESWIVVQGSVRCILAQACYRLQSRNTHSSRNYKLLENRKHWYIWIQRCVWTT